MLKLEEKFYERLITDVKKASSNEACGILNGKKEGGEETLAPWTMLGQYSSFLPLPVIGLDISQKHLIPERCHQRCKQL